MLSFSLFGRVVVSKDGKSLDQFRSQKELALLIYLAHTQKSHPREMVAELLWEGRTKQQAASNLRTALARLRKRVGDALQVTRKTIALAPDSLQQVDSVRLLQQLNTSGAITSAEKATTLHSILATYQGDFLGDFALADAPQFEEWVAMTRTSIQLRVIRAYEKLGDFALAANDTAASIEIARRWLEVDPLNEAAHALLIRAHLANGDTAAANAQYEQAATLLQTELGVALSAETTALLTQTRPPRAERTPIHHNVPAEYDQFIGRKAAQRAIHTRLDQPYCRLVTIVGQGGAGKTRISKQIARHRLDRYVDGVWLIELAELDPTDPNLPEAIAIEVATSLELRLNGAATPIDQLLTFLQPKQMLLVLDNFEHLLDGTPLILDILKRCDQVQMLVTSRELLGLRAEWVVDLAGLRYPSDDADTQPSDAVELFMARQAQQRRDGFSAESNGSSHDDRVAIRTICRVVGGLPLAIELAAALTRTLSCQTIADTLHDGFGVLKSSLRDMPARHQNLRVVFEMSWQTLSPTLRVRLARLATFRGGFSADAAREIADAEPQHISALREKSLLAYDVASERYTLHAVVRSYAAKKRAADDPIRQKHAHYYLNLLAQHGEPLQKQTPNLSVDALKPDIDNIRLAWRTGLAEQETERLLAALTPLSIYHQLRGLSHEGEAIMHRTLKRARKWGAGGLQLAARAGLERARFQNRLGRHHPALQTLQLTLQMALQCRDRWAEGMAHVWWGESLWRLGKYEAASEQLDDALSIGYATEEPLLIGWAHHQLGIVDDIQARYDSAIVHLEHACEIWRMLDHINLQCVSLNSVALVYHHRGDLARASELMLETLSICERTQNQHLQAILFGNLGTIANMQGNFNAAKEYFLRSLALASETGDQSVQADATINLGYLYTEQGILDDALVYLTRGLESAELLGDDQRKAVALLNLGNVRTQQQEIEVADGLYQQALHLTEQKNLKYVMCHVLIGLARLWGEIRPNLSQQYGLRAIETAQSIQNERLAESARAIIEQLSGVL